jgi:aspartyl-tRNA(Asn)/glutamyl-tRNA(Gln) amidotransferase subunit C
MAAIDIAHLCRLAQLALDDSETRAVQDDLERIIRMVDQMQAVDTRGIEPLAHPVEGVQRLRADEITETVDRALCQSVAPAVADGLYLVPRVVE